jgi:hypothetical protein
MLDSGGGDFPVEAVRIAKVPGLERVGERFYINLWPENLFGLAVDGDLREVPHICAWNPVLVESKFYPLPVQKQSFSMLLGTRFTPKNPDQSPPPIRTHRTPVYIIGSSLPFQMLHDTQDILAVWKYPISFLENEAQREKLLSTLAGQRNDIF